MKKPPLENYSTIILPTIDILLDRGTYAFAKQRTREDAKPVLHHIPSIYLDILKRPTFEGIPGYSSDVQEAWKRNGEMIKTYVIDHDLKKGHLSNIGDNIHVFVDNENYNNHFDQVKIVKRALEQYKDSLLIQAGSKATRYSLGIDNIRYQTPSYAHVNEEWAERAVLTVRAKEHQEKIINAIQEKEDIFEKSGTTEAFQAIPASHIKNVLELPYDPMYNQFLILEDEEGTAIYRAKDHAAQKYFVKIDTSSLENQILKIWNHKNTLRTRQKMALDLLFDDTIKNVFLIGPKLAGKTTLAMASAETQILNPASHLPKQDQITLISSLPEHHGYKTPEELRAAYVSFQNVYGQQTLIAPFEELLKPAGMRAAAYERSVPFIGDKMNSMGLALPPKPLFKLLPPGYLRGISLNQGFIILDDAQDEYPFILEEALSRVGEHGKFIVIGSPEQVNRNGLDEKWNGITVPISNLIGKAYVGVMPLDDSFGLVPTPR